MLFMFIPCRGLISLVVSSDSTMVLGLIHNKCCNVFSVRLNSHMVCSVLGLLLQVFGTS
jgi:hypothetical protein